MVNFIGAGPGDPELITVRGARLLSEADVVIYTGSLIGKGLLKHCRKDALVIDSAGMTLEEITRAMADAARSGKRVARLQTGDPSLYSAMREQAAALEEEGIGYGVVPGVSSAFAAAAALKSELTAPGVTQTVIFTRLEGRTPVPEAEGLAGLASHKATVCVFLSAGMIERVVGELLKGYPPATPAAVVYRASWDDEARVTGTLADIAEKARSAGITRHALIMVGDALGRGGPGRSRLYDKGFRHGFRR
jgi:precorrin-4/cobalt-precorrin-4 C11-methyltransferase